MYWSKKKSIWNLTLYIRESDEKICPHLNGKPRCKTIIILDTDNLLSEKEKYRVWKEESQICKLEKTAILF